MVFALASRDEVEAAADADVEACGEGVRDGGVSYRDTSDASDSGEASRRLCGRGKVWR